MILIFMFRTILGYLMIKQHQISGSMWLMGQFIKMQLIKRFISCKENQGLLICKCIRFSRHIHRSSLLQLFRLLIIL